MKSAGEIYEGLQLARYHLPKPMQALRQRDLAISQNSEDMKQIIHKASSPPSLRHAPFCVTAGEEADKLAMRICTRYKSLRWLAVQMLHPQIVNSPSFSLRMPSPILLHRDTSYLQPTFPLLLVSCSLTRLIMAPACQDILI